MYNEHNKNLKYLSYSLKEVEKQIKYSIKTENPLATTLNNNIHSFLTGAWIEVSLYKLIHEVKFTDEDRMLILTPKKISLEEKWKNTLNLAFSKAFSISTNSIGLDSGTIISKLSRTQQHRYNDILNFINTDLQTVVTIRNKIAHGQWQYVFNNKMTALEPTMQQEIRRNNYFDSKRRLATTKVLISMIHDISMSPKTFDRDFDKHYKEIENIKVRYNPQSYRRNVEEMKKKFARAELWKDKNKEVSL